jgi:hypothetical protein
MHYRELLLSVKSSPEFSGAECLFSDEDCFGDIDTEVRGFGRSIAREGEDFGETDRARPEELDCCSIDSEVRLTCSPTLHLVHSPQYTFCSPVF